MKKLPVISPRPEIPETFANYMSPISWLAALTNAYNSIADKIFDISVDENSNCLVISESEGESNEIC